MSYSDVSPFTLDKAGVCSIDGNIVGDREQHSIHHQHTQDRSGQVEKLQRELKEASEREADLWAKLDEARAFAGAASRFANVAAQLHMPTPPLALNTPERRLFQEFHNAKEQYLAVRDA